MWTKKQQAEAHAEGWGVFDVCTDKAVVPTILPLKFTPKMPHAPAMLNFIIARAHVRDALAIAALRHISVAKGHDHKATNARRQSRG